MFSGVEEAARIRERALVWIVLTPEKLSATAVKVVDPEKVGDAVEAMGGESVGGRVVRADVVHAEGKTRAACCESVQKNGAGRGNVASRRESWAGGRASCRRGGGGERRSKLRMKITSDERQGGVVVGDAKSRGGGMSERRSS